MSMYLENDYAFLEPFDADLFLEDLVNCRLENCSSFLVNALLSIASQGYASVEPDGSRLSYEFERESQRLWVGEMNSDSLTTVAGLALLSETMALHGYMAGPYLQSMLEMSARMKLFGVQDRLNANDYVHLSPAKQSFTSYAAMDSLYDIVVATPYPPSVPFPGERDLEDIRQHVANAEASARGLIGQGIPFYCAFWTIASEAMVVYRPSAGRQQVPLAFALSKYYKLLSLADKLSNPMTRNQHNPAQVLVFHIWYHVFVLDLFRPFISDEKQHDFSQWVSSVHTPEAIFAASLRQLKRLVSTYCTQHRCATTAICWSTGLQHVANAVLNNLDDEFWKSYFLLCIRGYAGLSASFQAASGIARGLLGMALGLGAISREEAIILNNELRANSRRYTLPEASVEGFTLDLYLAQSDQRAARVEELIDKFDGITVFDEYTTGLS